MTKYYINWLSDSIDQMHTVWISDCSLLSTPSLILYNYNDNNRIIISIAPYVRNFWGAVVWLLMANCCKYDLAVLVLFSFSRVPRMLTGVVYRMVQKSMPFDLYCNFKRVNSTALYKSYGDRPGSEIVGKLVVSRSAGSRLVHFPCLRDGSMSHFTVITSSKHHQE